MMYLLRLFYTNQLFDITDYLNDTYTAHKSFV